MMNESTKPNSASASMRPMPMNMVPRTMPAASGWRAMASTDFPMRIPIPIPGPMAASPYTNPLPIAVTSPVVWATRATAWVNSPIIDPSFSCLVLLRHGPSDVGGGEHGEDECLQPGHEDLEGQEQGP